MCPCAKKTKTKTKTDKKKKKKTRHSFCIDIILPFHDLLELQTMTFTWLRGGKWDAIMLDMNVLNFFFLVD